MEEVKFNLINSLTMPELLKAGYRREDIIKLFETLENNNFGVFHKGKRGKGCCSFFEKNEKCPNEFVVHGRNRYNKKTSTSVVKAEPIISSESTSVKLQTINALWNLSQNIVQDVSSCNIGYRCDVFAGQILVLHRIRGGGESTIKEALQNVWDIVSDKINIDIEEAISKLRGHGFCLLR